MSELKWAQPLLGDVAAVVDPHPSHRAPPEVDGGVPFVGIGDLTERGEVLASSARKVSPKVLDEHKTRYSVARGDIAYGRVATVGKVMRFGEINEPFALSPTMALIQPHGVAASYLAHFLQSKQWDDESAKLLTGTTRSSLGIQLLRKIHISCPRTFEEQDAIGSVLDTLDTAIHETEAIIAKLKAVKQGLLHDLLTRGIDANGELRPPQAEAPHLYKESPLGWIPKEWDVVHVGEDADIEHGFAFPGHQFTDKEVGPVLLVPGNFHREGGLYFTSENTKYFSGKFPQQYVLSRGDVLIVMTDLSPMTLILGRTVVLDEDFKVLHNQRIGKFRFRKDGLWDAAFFAETLSQDAVRLKVIAEATGTTVQHTSPDRIKSCYVARPKLQEQQCAAERIAVLDLRRKREETNFLKLKQTKSGLMDDLLTGRVRVTQLLAEAAQQAGSA